MRNLWTKIKPYIKGWRTVALNILAMVVPIISATEWLNVLPKEWLPYYALGLALLNIFLRGVTNTPVGKSK